MIDIGCYIEAAIEWLTEEGAVFFDALSHKIRKRAQKRHLLIME